jgi:putative ABC transport system permease protein
MFVLGGVVALAIALATVGYQALHAAAVNPVKNLRTE